MWQICLWKFDCGKFDQVCQIFLGTTYQNEEYTQNDTKSTSSPLNIPNSLENAKWA
jgi:hypothetical protein